MARSASGTIEQPTKPVERAPALIIGLGGTGVNVLRLIEAIAQAGSDPGLTQDRDGNRLLLFGVDTERESNTASDIDLTTILEIDRSAGQGRLLRPGPLPVLDSFFPLEAAQIAATVERLEQDNTKRRHGGGSLPDGETIGHPAIDAWYPWRETDDGAGISDKQTSTGGGAQQYRPLGRVALFRSLSDFIPRLEGELQQLTKDDPRVVIVSSLAGGTGAGIFWDVALLVRMTLPRCPVHGFFVLPDTHRGATPSERIAPNAYAALMELAAWTNWADRTCLNQVNYPGKGEYRATANGSPVFDDVFVQAAVGVGADGADNAVQRSIAATCYVTAVNLLAWLRLDIRHAARYVPQNAASPSHRGESQERRRHVFGAIGARAFPFIPADYIRRFVALRMLRMLADSIDESNLDGSGIDFELPCSSEGGEQTAPKMPGWLIGVLSNEFFADHVMLSEVHSGAQQYEPAGIARTVEVLTQAANSIGPDIWITRSDVIQHPIKLAAECKLPAPPGVNATPGPDGPLVGLIRGLVARALTADKQDRTDHAAAILDRIAGPPTVVFAPAYASALDRARQRVDDGEVLGPTMARTLRSLPLPGDPVVPVTDTPIVDIPVPLAKLASIYDGGTSGFFPKLFGTAFGGAADLQPHYSKLLVELAGILRTRYTKDRQRILDLLATWPAADTLRLREVLLVQARELVARDDKNRAHLAELRQSLLDRERALLARVAARFSTADDPAVITGPVFRAIVDCLRYRLSRPGQLAREVRVRETHPALALLHKEMKALTGRAAQSDWDHVLERIAEPPVDDKPSLDVEIADLFVLQFPLRHAALVRLVRLGGVANATETLERLCDAFIDIVLHDLPTEASVIQVRIGGTEPIDQTLRAIRSNVFAPGYVESNLPIKQPVLAVPKELAGDAKDPGVRAAWRMLRSRTRTIFGKDPADAGASDIPLVFLEDLYHPAVDIAQIRDLHLRYMDVPRDERRLLHVHRDAADLLPSLVHALHTGDPVLCGNPGCDADLRIESHSRLFCPKCERPIRSRCGNVDCTADDVDTRLRRVLGSAPPESVTSCPACHGPLKTSFWHCDVPSHAAVPIHMDEEFCPQCVVEESCGERRQANMSRRPRDDDTRCPGCATPAEKRANAIPAGLMRFYRDGVGGESNPTFNKLIAKPRRNPFVCEGEDPKRHFIFPTCPEGCDDPPRRHHLRRGPSITGQPGHFQCGRHPDLAFHECDKCRYPLHLDTARLSEPTECPRCLTLLQYCATCSDRDDRLFPPTSKGNPGESICPRCDNPMQQFPPVRDLSHAELASHGFCGNLFGCHAGAAPWNRQARGSALICEACFQEPRQALHSAQMLASLVYACPICSILIGLPHTVARTASTEATNEEHNDVVPLVSSHQIRLPEAELAGPIVTLKLTELKPSPDAAKPYKARFEAKSPIGGSDQICPICSFNRLAIYEYIADDHRAPRSISVETLISLLSLLQTSVSPGLIRDSLFRDRSITSIQAFNLVMDQMRLLRDENTPSGQALSNRLQAVTQAFRGWQDSFDEKLPRIAEVRTRDR